VVFCSATVWAGGVAAQRPITCPNRQLQPERYAKHHHKDICDQNITSDIKLIVYTKGFFIGSLKKMIK
jgi:hypothetical protein